MTLLIVYFSLFSFGTLSIVLVINKYFKKFFDHYWLRVLSASLMLGYLILFRFAPMWIQIGNLFKYEIPSYWDEGFRDYYSHVLSKSFFLDLCPFFSVALFLTMIIDRSKYWSFLVSPFCIFASTIVIPFVPLTDPNPEFSFWFIFYGSPKAELYFFMHWILLVFGCLAYQNYSLKNKNAFKIWVDIQLVATVFFCYIIIISFAFNIDKNTTGLSYKDWMKGGSFYAIYKMLHLPHPLEAVAFYIFAYIVINSIWLIKYYCANRTFTKINKNRMIENKNSKTSLEKGKYIYFF
ncbi:DUF5378 family protein [Mycoplasma hafezii]|uniref:DUF5378 family protein n=1 Tax=Mycoplasma hafezii TaxID=525886 RepID=UPI003CF4C312